MKTSQISSAPALRTGFTFALARLRSRVFWQVQAMVLTLSGAHYLLEYLEFAYFAPELAHVHHVPVMLYVVPIIYAGMRYGWEGGLLTGLWCAVLTLPNVLLWHRQGFEWAVEGINVAVALGVGVVVAMLVEHQRAERRRAEKLARQLLQAHEEERRRIARDLHDGPVQELLFLVDDLEGVLQRPELDRDCVEVVTNARSIVESALGDIRTFSRDLRPSVLDDLGLVPALQWLTRSVSERGALGVHLQVDGRPARLPPEEELALFRIAQEALHNVERHGGATHASVELVFAEGGGWRMAIRDDGRGFDSRITVGDLVARGHLGLHGMYERAELVGARLHIRTSPGRGTTIEVVSEQGKSAAANKQRASSLPAPDGYRK